MTRPPGFTLLETLVALAILGLILAFYGGSLDLTLRSVARQSGRVEAADDRETTARTLRRLLDALQPVSEPSLVDAGAHRFRFVTVLPGSDDPVEATLERDGGRLMLVWRTLRHARPLAPPPRPVATEIAAGIGAIDFSYFKAGNWTTSLPPGQLPELVRVHLVPQQGSAGADLIAAPRQEAPA